MGEKANIFKAQYLSRHCGRRYGRHKCEGHAHYLGRSIGLPLATVIARYQDGAIEVSRGHSRLITVN